MVSWSGKVQMTIQECLWYISSVGRICVRTIREASQLQHWVRDVLRGWSAANLHELCTISRTGRRRTCKGLDCGWFKSNAKSRSIWSSWKERQYVVLIRKSSTQLTHRIGAAREDNCGNVSSQMEIVERHPPRKICRKINIHQLLLW